MDRHAIGGDVKEGEGGYQLREVLLPIRPFLSLKILIFGTLSMNNQCVDLARP
jgi:hypothetical protein